MMREDLPTFVYAIRCGDWIKIGVAKDIGQRMGGMRVNCPYPIELVGSRRFANASTALRIESALHTDLKPQLHFGEWFRTEPIDPVEALIVAYDREGLEPVSGAIDARKPFSVFPDKEMPPVSYDDIFGGMAERTVTPASQYGRMENTWMNGSR